MASIAAFSSSVSSQQPKSCPTGRAFERQVQAADVIVLGRVTFDRDCLPSRVDSFGTPFEDCAGRRIDLVVERSWKGPLRPRDGIALLMPGPQDSAGMFWRKGQTQILFAKSDGSDSLPWWGYTDACMYPDGYKSKKELIKELDSWKRKWIKRP